MKNYQYYAHANPSSTVVGFRVSDLELKKLRDTKETLVKLGNNTFVAVGLLGNIVRSTDNSSSWDNATSPTSNHLYGVTGVTFSE